MRQYLKYFTWAYITIGVLAVILLGISGLHRIKSNTNYYERTNTECFTTQRVFDYADVLTDEEEQKLSELIDKRQKETCCDIVLVTLNESLKEYARDKEPNVPYSEFVRVFAEDFYETNNFGYDKPNGDGIVLVDNWYREDNGSIYTWLCTTGIVKDTYSAGDIDHILDRVYRDIETNSYKAYKTYIDDFYDDMMGMRVMAFDVSISLSLVIGVIAAVLFILANWKSKSGKDTTNAATYLEGKKSEFTKRQDVFLRKTVTKRHIDTNSSGGGRSGGGGGGGSHGGGGHSR